MTKPSIIKYTSPKGETFYGVLLSWPRPGVSLAEVFWDNITHPLVKELRVVYQCSVPNEREPEIGWVRISNGVTDGGDPYTYEILGGDAKVQWKCPEIVNILKSDDPKGYITKLDRGYWLKKNMGKFVEKDFHKHASVAKEVIQEET
jgi:hypothetical protein